jgi:hypothetical protein
MEWRWNLYGRCPFCNERAFVAYLIKGNWRCRSCNEYGDTESFAEKAGIPLPAQEILQKKDAPVYDRERRSSEFSPLASAFQNVAMTVNGSAGVHSEKARHDTKGKLLSRSVQQRQIKKLSARHHEIIERLIVGQKPLQICRDLGIG